MKETFEKLLKKKGNRGDQIEFPSYREQLVKDLETLKSFGNEGEKLAKLFLTEQEITEEYLRSLGKNEKLGKDKLKQLIKKGSPVAYSLFLKYYNKFEYDNSDEIDEIIVDMIKYSDHSWVTETIKQNWQKFSIKSYENILIEVCDCEKKDRSFIEFILEKGNLFTEKTIDKLIEHYHEYLIINYLEKFGLVSHQVIVNKLIEAKHGKIVGKNLEKFQGVNHQEIVNKLIETGQGEVVGMYLEKFQGVNHQDIVNKLIETGQGEVVGMYLEKFQGVNHQDIVNKLIETGQGEVVLNYKEDFQLEDRTEPMNRLSKCLELGEILYKIGEFPGSIHQDIINRVDINDEDLLERLHHSIGCVACQLSCELAEKYCDFGWIGLVAENKDKFERLNAKIAEMFVKNGYHKVVLEDPEKFGLKKSN